MPRTIGPSEPRPSRDARPARVRLGLLVLVTDHTTERDFHRLVGDPEVAVYVNRVAYANPLNADNLRAMRPYLRDAAAAILPDEPLDALAFSCTSGSALIGDDAVRATLDEGKPGVPAVTPTAAAGAAFEALGVSRVALLAPYEQAVSETLAAYFADTLGVTISTLQYLDYDDDREIARIPPDAVVDLGTRLLAEDPGAEALFVSCTATRAAETVERLEALTGRPVVTSNQAMIWRALRAAGETGPITGLGRLGRL
ncbi:MAG: hypothetical protein U5K43_00765 [Halofilum sp. (in: g-proteobacteria)]|nr:hypothetical protein [Halofilum sp. (in: g-proteobacteria)]